MMKFILLFFFSLPAFAQHIPYKIVIIADAEALERAEEFKSYLMQKPPFSKMGTKLDITVKTMPKEDMNCKNDMPDSPRIINCNHQKLFDLQTKENAHIALAFTSSGSGGAGGSIPVASKDYPIQTMFHEMLHAYGLDDEYSYSANEQKVYCDNPRNSGNLVYFREKPPYSEDKAARDLHKDDVPWMSGIPEVKKITNGSSLGTEEKFEPQGQQTLGLYRGGACDSNMLPGWRPYANSIMRGYIDDTIYPLYEEIIVKNIESALGRRLNLPPPTIPCLNVNFNYNQIFHLKHQTESILFRMVPDDKLKMKPHFK